MHKGSSWTAGVGPKANAVHVEAELDKHLSAVVHRLRCPQPPPHSGPTGSNLPRAALDLWAICCFPRELTGSWREEGTQDTAPPPKVSQGCFLHRKLPEKQPGSPQQGKTQKSSKYNVCGLIACGPFTQALRQQIQEFLLCPTMERLNNQSQPSVGRCETGLCLTLKSKSGASLCPRLFHNCPSLWLGKRNVPGCPGDPQAPAWPQLSC